MSSSSESADVVICGGAAIGSSVAYHLAADPGFKGKVVVVEKDPTYRLAASALSAASIRQQYSSAVNIRISLFGIDFLRNLGTHLAVDGETPVIDLHEGGYLYLGGDEGAPILSANQALQAAEGADIALYAADMLRSKFGWLNTSDLVCGTYGVSGEGWFDGWALLQAFRRKARSLGVEYRQGEVAGYSVEGGRVTGVELTDGSRIACGAVVNASGTHGARLAATAGVVIPVKSMKRYVFSFTCKGEVDNCPLLIDTTGVWCRPEGKRGGEGQLFIGSSSPANEADQEWIESDPGVEDVDWSFFEETVWPALAHRIPAFEQIRPGRAWAGPYDMNGLDHNAIIGPAVGVPNLYLANGFSGHGLQQSPAVGRGLAEHILHGSYRTLDLADLGHERIVEGRPLKEANII
ncbi:NAD(P)/FAD-dependent oxidoreductase [Bosea psychrotolerans]|uniref:Glycine/D-amino acid oxidase-like deaminating enzyme n=1 Tax=Bosea psychrotolerans TaxID=1871628 RepID=A0A2S4MF87_9HYPH|nr:FAD-binding oxidoreductase [Bosea psychrotolerans]POR53402.1 glycine/D-amino acid oxidase-like deaminating enzyme [Bosea psychrotolerans]